MKRIRQDFSHALRAHGASDAQIERAVVAPMAELAKSCRLLIHREKVMKDELERQNKTLEHELEAVRKEMTALKKSHKQLAMASIFYDV